MDESRSIEFGLSFSDKIKCIQQFKHVLMMNFKNLEKCDILKMRKKSTFIKISSVWCFFFGGRVTGLEHGHTCFCPAVIEFIYLKEFQRVPWYRRLKLTVVDSATVGH